MYYKFIHTQHCIPYFLSLYGGNCSFKDIQNFHLALTSKGEKFYRQSLCMVKALWRLIKSVAQWLGQWIFPLILSCLIRFKHQNSVFCIFLNVSAMAAFCQKGLWNSHLYICPHAIYEIFVCRAELFWFSVQPYQLAANFQSPHFNPHMGSNFPRDRTCLLCTIPGGYFIVQMTRLATQFFQTHPCLPISYVSRGSHV